jgi:hypothetical protein
MRGEIAQIESENNLLETQMRNFQLLDAELSKLIVISFFLISWRVDWKFQKKLNWIWRNPLMIQMGEFYFFLTFRLKDILEALTYLENGIDGSYQDNMDSMSLVVERKKVFEQKRLELVKRFKDFLKKLFFKLGDQIIKDKKPREELTLDVCLFFFNSWKKHNQTHETLFYKYKPLMKSSAIADHEGYKGKHTIEF